MPPSKLHPPWIPSADRLLLTDLIVSEGLSCNQGGCLQVQFTVMCRWRGEEDHSSLFVKFAVKSSLVATTSPWSAVMCGVFIRSSGLTRAKCAARVTSNPIIWSLTCTTVKSCGFHWGDAVMLRDTYMRSTVFCANYVFWTSNTFNSERITEDIKINLNFVIGIVLTWNLEN
jgi:hypothetical protein